MLSEVADKMYQTNYDGNSNAYYLLEDTIKFVLKQLFFKIPDVNIYRDEIKIRDISPAYLKKNSLASKHPEIATEWYPTKNGNLKPEYFLCGSGYDAWWLCSKCGHEWQSKINTRVNQKTGCKQCYLERIKTKCPNNKTIYQYSLDGSFLKEWRSASYAGRELHINVSNISMCANGIRPNAGGFKWSYVKK